ncbi:PKD domain-containing protein [Desulfuromonas acetoxidans]|uniref:PKD domain protein n=1 Tax=Desulfuromonas acetoxidans (strain DSM 684 / 11070) TaxID=281689 RepID=Q1K245_DESA6|nr:PKD domain-containing protein [Desulfuromonas acetoxidans]EAT16594.1 PKD domain protein [Desulfuromonas acetoxidans DSM 684]MBF0644441.1 hypothetical protein [Desulfuromonas acetoxidans]NVD24705.1 hypothetical protein [Desulfuromonas acetoxidans]NVE16750.1 hypothetical protein [Desulfuromonas acetoxidans]
MKKILFILVCFTFLILNGGCSSDNDHHASTNHVPVADAGPDQNVTLGTVVQLDGSNSTDQDGDTLTYSWIFSSLPAGSSATLSDDTAARPTFTADVEGNYELNLIVSDDVSDSLDETVLITASAANSAPVADAGTDQNVLVDDTVNLDGSGSSDTDGDPLTYTWRFISVPGGSTATLSDTSAQSPSFTADTEGSYQVGLVVNDGSVDSAESSTTITATLGNATPVADAGEDQNVSVGDTVNLDGSSSSDADGDPLTYSWSITSAPATSTATLSDVTSATPTFTVDVYGDYVFSLTVNDGEDDSAIDTITISTQFAQPANHVAVNFTIDDSASATYDNTSGLAWKGSFSYNADTRILTYNGAWPGPYVLVYDDGPWTTGGHEPSTATANDHIWGVTVWISNSTGVTLEYGAISGSVDGSDGVWIWTGSNGNITIPAGTTTPINAPGLVLP